MWPRRQKASVTDGLRWAPERRPSGLTATREPVPAKRRPVINSRAEWSPTTDVTGLPGAKSKHMADRPPRSSSAVPTNSQAHSVQCQPPWKPVPMISAPARPGTLPAVPPAIPSILPTDPVTTIPRSFRSRR